MSNLPILYFTLGMLAGLPLGYRMGAVWYERVLPMWAESLNWVAYTVLLEDVMREADSGAT